jgi:mannan endo-1,6-alpha-mannosidase
LPFFIFEATMRFLSTTGAVLLSFASFVSAVDLDPESESSIKSVSSQYAYGLMSQYKNNGTTIPKEEIGVFPKPHYWWFSGALWGGLVEYTAITKDQSYVKSIQQALVANYGPDKDIVLPWKRDQEGNDDQAFWALTLMSALEYDFPEPQNAPASYLQVTVNAFNTMVSRWDTGTCGGGLRWQIYPENAYGWDYKNTISNGAVFALGARLYRYTGNQTYGDWSTKIYDWTKKVGLIGENFEVYDGTSVKTNCASITDKTEWSYNNAMFLHGSAFMYEVTKEDTWKDRVNGFLDHAGNKFFSHPQAKDVMVDVCEPSGKCNLDQRSFKAYLARFMVKTATAMPSTKETIAKYLKSSAKAAAKACPVGDGLNCGAVWYTGTTDGVTGLGQQLSALEVTQALLAIKQHSIPSAGDDAKPQPEPSSTKSTVASTPAATYTSSSVAPTSTSSRTSSAVPSPPPAAPESKTLVAAPGASSSTLSSAAAEASTSSCTSALSSTAAVGQTNGEVSESTPSFATSSTSCTPSTTVVTVYVPPTSAPETTPAAPTSAPVTSPAVPTSSSVAPPPIPTTPTTVLPVAPPANTSTNTTIPITFPGAASGIQLAGSTLLTAGAFAALAVLL